MAHYSLQKATNAFMKKHYQSLKLGANSSIKPTLPALILSQNIFLITKFNCYVSIFLWQDLNSELLTPPLLCRKKDLKVEMVEKKEEKPEN